MDNQKTFWEWFIDAATVVAAVMLYMKTAEVMTSIAPLTLLGQTGLQVIYGAVVAGMIEGVTLALHFVKSFKGNSAAEGYKWFLFAISAFCQFMDKFFVVDTGIQTANVEFFKFLTYGIPIAIFGGLLLVANSNAKRNTGVVRKASKPFKGIRTAWREFLDGTGNTIAPETQVYASEDKQEKMDDGAKLTVRPPRNK